MQCCFTDTKMKCESVLFVFLIFLPWISAQQESCVTPLGVQSQCISILQCSQLRDAFKIRPLPKDVIDFLRQSQCGFEGTYAKVCCGSLPSNTNRSPQPTQPLTDGNRRYIGPLDSINSEDSHPAPRGLCGLDTNGDRIIGGNATDLDEFPWMALLCYRTRSGKITCQCGGVLINHRYVLTAAHCLIGAVETQVGELVTVRLGEYNLDTSVDCKDGACADPPQDISVQAKYPHPNYNDGNKNRNADIGIVRLARRATYNYYVQPICLADSRSRQNVGPNMVVAGWGKTLQGRNSPIKQKLTVPIYDKNQCVNKYKTLGAEISENQICAGGNFAEDACRGDSGGPLMNCRRDGICETVGVISFGYGCGRDGWPGIYTSVAGYLDWILNILRSTNT